MSDLEDEGFVEGDSGSAPADSPGAIPSDDTPARADRAPQTPAGGFESSSVTSDIPVLRRPGKSARAAEARAKFAEAILASKQANAGLTASVAPTKPADEFDPEAETPPAATPAAAPAAPPPKPDAAAIAAAVIASPPAAAPPPAPSLDPEVRKLREEMKAARDQLAAELERVKSAATTPAPVAAAADAMSYEDYVDRPSAAYRTWLETMRGEKFVNDDEFKLEARDFITSIGADVLGVALSDVERNSLESRLARKAVRVSKTVASKREQLAAEKAERERAEAETKAQNERIEQEWSKAAEHVSAMFSPVAGADGKPTQSAAASSYPWLAAEEEPGKIVVDVIRAAMTKDGTQLSWQEASKKANDYLQAQATQYYEKRRPLLAPAATPSIAKPAAPAPAAPAAPAKSVTPAQRVNPQPVDTQGKFSKDKHRENTLAAYRAAFQPKT